MNVKKIAIVGAGVSGLVCANILSEKGLDVTIFDKGRFPGGRLASRNRDEYSFDYGAQYITARDPRFLAFLEPLIANGDVAVWDAEFGKYENGVLHAEQHIHPRYVGVPLMRSFADALAKSVKMLSSHRVKTVSLREEKWELSGTVTRQGDEEEFCYGQYDILVLNMPPAQASSLLPHAGLLEVLFSPCCALMMSFDQRLAIEFDGIKLDDETISWVARDSSKPSRGNGERWVVHSAPSWSASNFDLSLSEMEQVLSSRFSSLFNIVLPPLKFSKVHKWRYALPAINSNPSCIFDDDALVAYCGDWCESGKVEGAFLSGLATAEKIIRVKNLES